MSEFTKDLMRQLRFISSASNAFMSTRQKLTGQQRVLAILVKEDGLIQSQLAEILDIRPSSLAELMKKMEKSNDVLRKEEEHDKRIKRVFLTENGKQKAQKLSHVGEDMSEAFFAGLTEEEQENFSEYLQKISAGWQEEFQKQAGRFVDPMDRLRQMQAMREQFAEIGKRIGKIFREKSSIVYGIKCNGRCAMRHESFLGISIMIFVETFGAILTAITDQTKRKVQKIQNGTIFNIERKLVSYK